MKSSCLGAYRRTSKRPARVCSPYFAPRYDRVRHPAASTVEIPTDSISKPVTDPPRLASLWTPVPRPSTTPVIHISGAHTVSPGVDPHHQAQVRELRGRLLPRRRRGPRHSGVLVCIVTRLAQEAGLFRLSRSIAWMPIGYRTWELSGDDPALCGGHCPLLTPTYASHFRSGRQQPGWIFPRDRG